MRDIDERVAAERAPPVRRERVKVVVERPPDRLVLLIAQPRVNGGPPHDGPWPSRSTVNRGSARSLVRERARFAERTISSEATSRCRLAEPADVEAV